MSHFDTLLRDIGVSVPPPEHRPPTRREVRFYGHEQRPAPMAKSLTEMSAKADRGLARLDKAMTSVQPSKAAQHERVRTTLAKAFEQFQNGKLSALEISQLELTANRKHIDIDLQQPAGATPLAKSMAASGPSRGQIERALLKAFQAKAISAVGVSKVERMLNTGQPLPPPLAAGLQKYL